MSRANRSRSGDARPRLALVATVLLVVLAGCSVFAGGAEPTPADTVTPVPVPDLDPTATAPPATPRERLGAFPGISADGEINVSRLFTAHMAYLSTHSYTLNWERRTAGGSGPITREYDRRVAVDDDGTFLVRNRDSGTNLTVTYGDRDEAYRRVVSPNGTTVSAVSPRLTERVGERYAGSVTFEVLSFLNAGYASIDVVTREGRPYARIVTDHVPQEIAQTYNAYAIQDFKSTLWIAPEGYVRAIHYEFALRNIEENIAIEWRYTYDRVGETTVDRPAWVPDSAFAATPTPTPDPARVPPATVANGSTGG